MPDGEIKKRNPFAEEFLFSTVYREHSDMKIR